MLVAVLHFVPDEAQPRRIVETLLDALPSGSYLVASHATSEYYADRGAAAGRVYHERGIPFQFRVADELSEVAFRGLEMVEPGVVPVSDWQPRQRRPAAAARRGDLGRRGGTQALMAAGPGQARASRCRWPAAVMRAGGVAGYEPVGSRPDTTNGR